jgi:hypothetical protein
LLLHWVQKFVWLQLAQLGMLQLVQLPLARMNPAWHFVQTAALRAQESAAGQLGSTQAKTQVLLMS